MNNPCPRCGKWPRQDCGYGVWTSTPDGRDFDCVAPDMDGDCDNCCHVWCDKCKAEFKEWLFHQPNALPKRFEK